MPGAGRSVDAHYLIGSQQSQEIRIVFISVLQIRKLRRREAKSVGLERDAGSPEWKASSIWSWGKVCGFHTLRARTTGRSQGWCTECPVCQVPGNTGRAPRARDRVAEPRSRSHTEPGGLELGLLVPCPALCGRLTPQGLAGVGGGGKQALGLGKKWGVVWPHSTITKCQA